MKFYLWKNCYKKVGNPILLKTFFNVYGGLKYWVGKQIVTCNLLRQFNYDSGSCNEKNTIIS